MALPYTAGKWVANAAVVDYCAMSGHCVLSLRSPDPSRARPQIRLPPAPSSWPRYVAMPHPAVCKFCRLDEIALARYDTGGVSL